MYVDDLMLEVTRKCNLRCEHCLRGNAQNKSMSRNIIDALFRHVDSVGTLTIGGGEPTLAIDVLWDVYNSILQNHVDIQNIYMVTNGKTLKRELVQVFSQLYQRCSDNEVSGFAVSNDQYHVQQRGFTRNVYEYEELCYENEDEYGDYYYLPEDVFQTHTSEGSLYTSNVFARGRAKDWGGRHEDYLDCLKLDNLRNPQSVFGQFYVCYNGDVVGDSNMPYIDMKKYVRGNVTQWWQLMEGLQKSTIENYEWCKENCSSFGSCAEYETLEQEMNEESKEVI